MIRPDERRVNPRLRLSYPIRVESVEGEGSLLGRTVTQDLSARGAYFATFSGDQFELGREVAVVLSVPHKFSSGGEEVMLDLRGKGRVVRVVGPAAHRTYGEDGAALVGVALEFAGPLSFQYRWVA